tara:strand:+ start:799 stop:1023 length:225 start_codon:yes stop_codon:yes gene_type:complete
MSTQMSTSQSVCESEKVSAQEKYEEMKRNALNLNCAELNDLPPLECITCQKIRSFGGRQTFETNIFTIVDICKC